MSEISVRRAEFGDVNKVTEIQAGATKAIFADILGADNPALQLINPRDLRGTWRNTLPAVHAWLASHSGSLPGGCDPVEDPAVVGSEGSVRGGDCGMAVILPRDTKSGLVAGDVGELVVEALPGPDALEVMDALIATAIDAAKLLELHGLGVWVMSGDDLHTRALSQRGFEPEGVSQLLENPNGSTLRAHLWGLALVPTA